jgi:hypothetical protein
MCQKPGESSKADSGTLRLGWRNPMATLTTEQRKLLHESRGEPVRQVDSDTNREYGLLAKEIYDQLRSAVANLEPRDFYPALHRALGDEGWDNP